MALRKLAMRGHYPAIDVLESVSRLMSEVCDAEHREALRQIRELLAWHRAHEDLISIGDDARQFTKSTSRKSKAFEPFNAPA